MSVIATIEQLEAIYGFPGESSTVKVADRVLIEKIAVRGTCDLGSRRARLRSRLHAATSSQRRDEPLIRTLRPMAVICGPSAPTAARPSTTSCSSKN